MSLSAVTFRLHRWLGWLVGLQVLIWVTGGLVFSLVPFEPWVKAHETVHPPSVTMPAGWVDRTAASLKHAAAQGEVAALAAVATPRGPAVRVSFRGGEPAPVLLMADGSPWVAPDADAVAAFARSLYRGDGAVRDVARVAEVPRRLGIVAETGGRGDLWRVRFDDTLSTRLYFHGATSEFLTARNEAWVWYDFFWRLHIMDYEGGEDFNGTLLRVASIAAYGLVIAGAVLAWLAARRRWRAMRKPARA